MNKEAGKKLSEARKKMKWTQEDLAQKLGFTTKQLGKYEAGNFPAFKSKKVKEMDVLLGTKLYEEIYEQKVLIDEDGPETEYSIKAIFNLTETNQVLAKPGY